MEIKLSNSFSYGRLFRFAMPSVIMMLFSSIYGVVDGLFVSNFVGKTEFAAINLLMPVLMIIGAFGFMIGAGGTAVVSKTLGEGDEKLANRYFSLFVYLIIAVGASMSLLGIVFIRPLSMMCIRLSRRQDMRSLKLRSRPPAAPMWLCVRPLSPATKSSSCWI